MTTIEKSSDRAAAAARSKACPACRADIVADGNLLYCVRRAACGWDLLVTKDMATLDLPGKKTRVTEEAPAPPSERKPPRAPRPPRAVADDHKPVEPLPPFETDTVPAPPPPEPTVENVDEGPPTHEVEPELEEEDGEEPQGESLDWAPPRVPMGFDGRFKVKGNADQHEKTRSVFNVIRSKGPLRVSEIVALTGMSDSLVRHHLDCLLDNWDIQRQIVDGLLRFSVCEERERLPSMEAGDIALVLARHDLRTIERVYQAAKHHREAALSLRMRRR